MATYEIAVDQPNRPDGDPIEVPPVGLVENRGKPLVCELDKEQADALGSAYGVKVKRAKTSDKGGESE